MGENGTFRETQKVTYSRGFVPYDPKNLKTTHFGTLYVDIESDSRGVGGETNDL